MDFKRIDDYAKKALREYLTGTGYRGSDYSYHAFLCWFDDLEYADEGGAFYIRAFFNGELRYWLPLLKEGVKLDDALARLPKYSTLCFVTEPYKNALEDRYVACTNRDWSEYVYRAADFIGLAGKRYKAKRNHISKFLSLYKPEMQPYTQKDKEDFEEFEKIWFAEHSSLDGASLKSAEKESRIVRGWLNASLNGETICDVLRVDGKMIGISIGEIMGSGNAVVMYEKADINYEGVYSYLAHEFAARNLSSCEFINRQEDMGLPGLRKSKLSYYPETILDKYVLTLKELCQSGDDGKIIKPCEGDSSLNAGVSAAKNGVSTADNNVPTAENNVSIAENNVAVTVNGVSVEADAEIDGNFSSENIGDYDKSGDPATSSNGLDGGNTSINKSPAGERSDNFGNAHSSEKSAYAAKADEIKAAPLSAYTFRKLELDDFNAVMTFLKCGISRLENKLFFLNYTDSELEEVLSGGYMLGAFYEKHLVATCALDTDKDFGNKLAAICGEREGRQFYEFSGIMTCKFHRGKGLSNLLCKKVIDHAKEIVPGSTLCAAVQFDNVASLSNLKKLGFTERAEAEYKEYRFKYLTLKI